jgi:putative ABC transport system permease protein
MAVIWLQMQLLFDLAVSRPWRLLIEMRRDVRHSLRLWAKRPWNTGFAVAALGIAIGANTAVFSVVNALLLRELPFRDPARLAAVVHFLPPHESAAQFDSWRQHSNYLEDAALYEDGDLNLGDSQRMVRAHIAMTSSNFFDLLGAKPVIGRTFGPGAHSVAVISYALWQDLYAGNEQVLGKTIRVNGLQPHPNEQVTIIGVMPATFEYPAETVLWKTAEYTQGNNGWATIGRLKDGVGWARAREAFAADVRHIEPHRPFRANWIPLLMPLQDELAGHLKSVSLLLMAVVVFILLIACANLANLMFARTKERHQEISIRSALGASRKRLIQQVLTECLFLAMLSAGLGSIVAVWATTLANKAQPAALPLQVYTILDVRVLAFMIGLAAISAVLFGLLPALSVGRRHSFLARGSTEFRHLRMARSLLVSIQIALTIVLLTSSISVERGLSHELQMDRGFRADAVVTASVSLDGTRRDKPGLRLQYFEEVLDRLRHLPGVRSVSASEFLPLLSGKFLGGPYAFDGRRSAPGTGTASIPILPDYFRSTGGHVLYGREFTDAEVRSNANVVLVNETLARIWLPPSDALGHIVKGPDGTERRIVGVVRNLDFMGQYMADVPDNDFPETFIPAHDPGGFDSTFVVSVDGQPEDHVAAMRAGIETVDRGVPVYSVETMQHRMDRAFARPRFYRTALIFFATFALLLALIGTYAVVSYAVSQRTHEIGVKLALGTTAQSLRTTLVGQGLKPVAIGVLCGIACTAATGKLLARLVIGATGFDIATYALAAVAICLIAAASIWIATRRISALDVVEILRAE